MSFLLRPCCCFSHLITTAMSFPWRQFGIVEPIFFIYSYWMMLMFPVTSQYSYLRYSEDVGFPYMNVTEGGGGGGCGGEDFASENSTLRQKEHEVQTLSANLFTYYIICAVGPSIIVGPFMGSYADKRGRKPIIMLPLLGAIIETAINLAIMHFHLPLYLVLVGGFFNGISGYFVSLWLGLNSYLADTVIKSKLSNRMVLLNFALFFAGTVAQLTSGLWIEYLGFKAPVWFILIALILTLLYTYLFIKESIKMKVKANFFDPKTVTKFIQIFTKKRQHGRKNLFLSLIVVGTNVTFTVGTSAVAMLFVLRSPLCWPPSIVGYFLAWRFFGLGLGSAVFINVLKKWFSEVNITRMGFVSQIAGLLMFAFATKTWMVFLFPVVSILSAIQDPVLSSIASRIVGEDEQGMLFAVCGCLAAVGEVVGTSIFNTIYPLSLTFFPGFVFVLCAGCSVILLLVMSCFDTSKLADLNEVTLSAPIDTKEKELETTHL